MQIRVFYIGSSRILHVGFIRLLVLLGFPRRRVFPRPPVVRGILSAALREWARVDDVRAARAVTWEGSRYWNTVSA